MCTHNWHILDCYHCRNISSMPLYNRIMFALDIFDWFGDRRNAAGHSLVSGSGIRHSDK